MSQLLLQLEGIKGPSGSGVLGELAADVWVLRASVRGGGCDTPEALTTILDTAAKRKEELDSRELQLELQTLELRGQQAAWGTSARGRAGLP